MMKKTFAEDLVQSLAEALDHSKGKTAGVREHVIDVPDVRSIRERLKMSQTEFARAYRIPLPTLKGWEQGRRQPDATAAAYLSVIDSLPKETKAALTS
jgi:putative transcriptional regulator